MYEDLLREKGFRLNSFPEGKSWELVINNDDEERKIIICKSFSGAFDYMEDATGIDTLILQCAQDFSKCLFYYDCNSFNMSTEDFKKCVSQI